MKIFIDIVKWRKKYYAIKPIRFSLYYYAKFEQTNIYRKENCAIKILIGEIPEDI